MAAHTWVNRVFQVAPKSEPARISFLEKVILARRSGASKRDALQMAAAGQIGSRPQLPE